MNTNNDVNGPLGCVGLLGVLVGVAIMIFDKTGRGMGLAFIIGGIVMAIAGVALLAKENEKRTKAASDAAAPGHKDRGA